MHAKRSHTRTHRVRWATASHAESLTDRPRVCVCATPRRPLLSSTVPSRPAPTHMQKGRPQSVKVRPNAAMAHMASPSPVRARVPSERLTVGPRVLPPIAGRSSRAWRARRAGRSRATTLARLLCSSRIACGKVATHDGLVWTVHANPCAEMACGRGGSGQNGRGFSPRPRHTDPVYSTSIVWVWVAAWVSYWRSMRSYVDSIVSVRYLGPRVSPILSDLGPESGSEVNPINKQFRSVIVGAGGALRPLDSLVQASGQKLTLGL